MRYKLGKIDPDVLYHVLIMPRGHGKRFTIKERIEKEIMTNISNILDKLKYMREKFEKGLDCDSAKCNDCPFDCISYEMMMLEGEIENVIIDLTAMTKKGIGKRKWKTKKLESK